jgi:RNA polymerase sigma-70 factor, ECF subfamily
VGHRPVFALGNRAVVRHGYSVPTTPELVDAARRGDADAFGQLLTQFEAGALAVAYGVLLNADSARDAVQDASFKAWRRLGDLREPGKFGSWFCRITHMAACDVRRKKPAVPQLTWASVEDPADAACRSEDKQIVAAALKQLDEMSRTVVMLRYFRDYSSKQIGELLELTPAAVDMRLSRARGALREILGASVTASKR